jgi:hypothetical protein
VPTDDDPFFREIVKRGWSLRPPSSAIYGTEAFPVEIPVELQRFLSSFGSLTNERRTIWLNSVQDFTSRPDNEFEWNEFELISLAAAEGDDAWQREIRTFWASHLPILMSVDGRYEYLAYCGAGANNGRFVQGSEPEFEQVEVVASSLDEFKSWLLANAT